MHQLSEGVIHLSILSKAFYPLLYSEPTYWVEKRGKW